MTAPRPEADPYTAGHIAADPLLDGLCTLMLEVEGYLPDAVRDGKWWAWRTHVFERANSGPNYRLNARQLKDLKGHVK